MQRKLHASSLLHEFVGVVHLASFIAATFRYCFCAFHHQAAALGADFAGRFGFDCEFAGRVVGAGVENAKAAAPLTDVAGFADRTENSGPFFGFVGLVGLYEFALRIAGTGDEGAAAVPALAHHELAAATLSFFLTFFLAAQWARFSGLLWTFQFRTVEHQGSFAVRIAGAGIEFSGPGEFDYHRARAFRAFYILGRRS